jgi:hypothetical protein
MLTYCDAEKIAQAEIDFPTSGRCVLMRQYTITRPYGWVFFYQSKEYAETGNPDQRLMGNMPFLVDRANGLIHPVRPGRGGVEQFLAEYEATLPPEPVQVPAAVAPPAK